MAVDTACQRVVGSPQGVMEPCGIHYRKWNRIMVVIVTCQGARICRLKLDSDQSPTSVEVWVESSLRLGSWVESGSRRSLDEVCL